jgi:hypothetical protein
MLYDPKWQQTVEPSLTGFIAWLAQQHPWASYHYTPCTGCAIDGYLRSIGTTYEDHHAAGGYPIRLKQWNEAIAQPNPRTYGAALERARALASHS